MTRTFDLLEIDMSIPTYDKFIDPMLRFLSNHPSGSPAPVVYEAVADALGISEDERLELLPSKTQPIYKNRAGWAHDRLKRAGLSDSPRRGFWKLTDKGIQYANGHPQPLTPDEVHQLSVADPTIRLRPSPSADEEIKRATESVAWGTPDDQLEDALIQLREWTAEELLENIGRGSPKFFETLVLDVLHSMGYGASRKDLQHIGRSHDGGIDGIISLDRLGLEKVFVQAKRWQGSVGREVVQAFYGALAGQRARKGVMITTSTFTAHAEQFARSVDGIILIDGKRLTEFMIEYGVGVSHRTVKVPSIDQDYFEEVVDGNK
jgi:restriction system protein